MTESSKPLLTATKNRRYKDTLSHIFPEEGMPRLVITLFAVIIFHSAFFIPNCLADATWQAIGPFGGRVNALAIDPTNNQMIYAGTDGGLLKSINGGASWTAANNGMTSSSVRSIAIDPTNSQTVYAGAGGVYKSTDGGVTWEEINSGMTRADVWTLAIDPTNSQTVYAGTYGGGVFKTTNGGTSWTSASSGITITSSNSVWTLAIDPTNSQTVYAGLSNSGTGDISPGGLYKSTNGGASWTAANSGITTSTQIFSIAIDPTNSQTVYAGSHSGEVFKTTNGGTSWSAASSGIMGGIWFLTIDPNNSQIVYVGTLGGGVFKTTNGGVSWTATNSGITDTRVFSLAIDPTNSQTVYAGTWGRGVSKTANGGASWTDASIGMTNTDVRSIAIDTTNSQTVFVGAMGGIFKATNGGESWTLVNNGVTDTDIQALAIDPTNSQTIYAATWNSSVNAGVLKSTNGGSSWTTANSGIMNHTIRCLAIDPTNNQTIYAGGFKYNSAWIFKSTNGGTSWTSVNSGLTGTEVYSLAIDPTNSQTLYTVTMDSGIFKTTNGGVSWTAANNGISITSSTYFWSIAIDPSNSQTVFAGAHGGLFKSTDGGASWTVVNGGPNDVFSFAFDPTNSQTVYAGAAGGYIYKSTNGGVSWAEATSRITRTNVTSIAIDPSNPQTIYVGTQGSGVYKTNVEIQYDLTVAKSGTGNGSVTSNTGMITWSSGNTGIATYNNSTSVTLTATPDAGSTFAGWSGACTGTGTCQVTMNSSKIITATFTTSGAIQLPKTGQTKCYDAAWMQISCTGTGQDGDIQAGMAWPSPRFIDNGDQTVADKLTGLVWARDGNIMKSRDPGFDTDDTAGDGRVTWQQALDYIKKLNYENYLGYNDWRLPNVNELQSLANYGPIYVAIWLNSQGFINVESDSYWSSTPNSTYSNADYAWIVVMRDGYVTHSNWLPFYYVWPVRSAKPGESGFPGVIALPKTGQTSCYNSAGTQIDCIGTGQDGEPQNGVAWPEPRFKYNNDQTVTDMLTGLIWTKDASRPGPSVCGLDSTISKSWHGALDYVKCLNTNNYLGYNDWRLPNVNELLSLVNYGQYDVTSWLTSEGFSMSATYWSSTTLTWSPDHGWVAHERWMRTYYPKSGDLRIWPVRGGAVTESASPSSYSLTVIKSGTGSGAVTASSGTINWSDNIGTVTYNSGTTATLTAAPNSGSTFAGWSGNFSGTGSCTLSMLGNRNVIATFNLIPVDTTPPTDANILINNGATTTGSQQVTLTLSAMDPSGIGQMRFSNDNSTWSDSVSFANTVTWSLLPGNGPKTVYAKYSDSLGNWMTAPASTTITLSAITVPVNPTGLTVVGESSGTISLKWNRNPEDGVTYNVFRSQTLSGVYYQINTSPIGSESLIWEGGIFKVLFTDKDLKEGQTYYYKVQSISGGVTSTDLSTAVNDKTDVIDDYTVVVLDPSNILSIGNTVKYYVQLLPKSKFIGTLSLTCSGMPAGITYSFIVDGEDRGSSVTGLIPPASVTLKITAGSTTAVGEHDLQLLAQNLWSGGGSDQRVTDLTLTVLPRDGSGIRVEVDKQYLRKGEKVRIYGSIVPLETNRTITLTLTPNGGSALTKNITTVSGGLYEDTDWISTLGLGTYTVIASWTDGQSNQRTSTPRTFIIEKGQPVLTLLRQTGQQAGVGSDFIVVGNMKPVIAYAPLILQVENPDGELTRQSISFDMDGEYSRLDSFFTKKGLWKFRVYFTGNEEYIGAESNELIVLVEIDAGRAIILGGGVAEQTNIYWAVTEKLIADAYKDFKSKGFTDEMIWLMINSEGIDINNDLIDDPVVDVKQPTVSAFLDAIRTPFAGHLNADTPLFIYMFGHGTNDGRFKVLGDDQYVSASQIKTALDQLQVETSCPVVIILEACYSGTFIQELTSPDGYKRIILTSADDQPYRVDDTGRNAFSRFLFEKLKEGDDVRTAFNYALSTSVKMGYPAPQIDDGSGGTLAANTYLRGELIMGLKPVVSQVMLPLILDGVSSTPIFITVTRGDVSTEKVWVQVIAPNAGITGKEGTLSYPQTFLSWNGTTGKYEGQLGNLNVSGIYKIVAYAQDVNQEVSDPNIAYINVQGVSQNGDINGDSIVTLTDAILALQMMARIAPPAGASQEGYAPSTGDVNKDGKIGMAEVIFILQKVAGVR